MSGESESTSIVEIYLKPYAVGQKVFCEMAGGRSEYKGLNIITCPVKHTKTFPIRKLKTPDHADNRSDSLIVLSLCDPP